MKTIKLKSSAIKKECWPSGPPQSRINGIQSISGADDDDFTTRIQAIHQGQQCGDDAWMDLILTCRPNGSQSVDLVKENDRRTHLVGLNKQLWSATSLDQQQTSSIVSSPKF